MINKVTSIINKMLKESGQDTINNFENSLNLRDDLNFDSLMLAELTVRLEDEFNIDVFEDGIVQTLGEVIKKIEG
ncbi:acyl carrier protein [Bacillus cereus VD196]|uniref:Acyl carrier protein n=1 Tax=Bacillus cereus VD196 TaxID=1053243 RepID=A0A9W5PYB1_BACCE|nr:phosphopantetheine-binding protein [Bacillus cereus]EJR90592.1 acyl carrier protein [Bacillus cereus VD200]EOO60741.1 acyl carrier protein [Bacillus cereus VD196]